MPLQTASSLEPFRNRGFLTYWLTGLSSNFGWLIQMVGASWLMTLIGGTHEEVALIQTSIALPMMLFSLPAGALADAFGRRRVVMWSQSFLLTVSGVLAILAYYNLLTPNLLILFTFLIGCGKALNNPAWQTYVSELLPRSELPDAIALNSVGFNIARSVGPAIGGFLVSIIGAFANFAVNLLSNIGVLIMAARWKDAKDATALPPEPVISAMRAGIRYVAMSPHILLVVVRAFLFNFAAVSILALMPLIARDLLQGGPNIFGALLGAFGVGAIIGAVYRTRIRKLLSLEGLARSGFIVTALAALTLAYSPFLLVSILACACAGAAWLLTLSAFNTTVQISSPRWVVSRSIAIYQTAAFGGNALGSWVWGVIAQTHTIPVALSVSACALVFGGIAGIWLTLRELQSYDLDPHKKWQKPDLHLDILPRSGPIQTTIEYIIREEDVTDFLIAMDERKRSRRRDGARRWTLLRDMENTELWIEQYQTPTWVDTLRHHERRTVADAAAWAALLDMHQGEERPKARYEIVRPTGLSTISPKTISRQMDH